MVQSTTSNKKVQEKDIKISVASQRQKGGFQSKLVAPGRHVSARSVINSTIRNNAFMLVRNRTQLIPHLCTFVHSSSFDVTTLISEVPGVASLAGSASFVETSRSSSLSPREKGSLSIGAGSALFKGSHLLAIAGDGCLAGDMTAAERASGAGR